MSRMSLPVCMWIPLMFIPVFFTIRRVWGIWWMEIPNLESIWPTEMLVFPPAITCGFILIQTGTSGCFAPNCSRMERLSMLICTPSSAACSISSKETPLGVNIIFEGSTPASIPNCTSWIETVSRPAPRWLNNRSTDMFESAFTA